MRGSGKKGSVSKVNPSQIQENPSESIPSNSITYEVSSGVMAASEVRCAAMNMLLTDQLAYQASFRYDSLTENDMMFNIEEEVTGMLNLLLSESFQTTASVYPCMFGAKLTDFIYEDAYAASSISANSTIAGAFVGHNMASISVMQENDCHCTDVNLLADLNVSIQDVRSKEDQINNALQSKFPDSAFYFS